MFDCVMPTRHARNGQVFTWEGRLNIRLARFRDDARPLDPRCGCPACRRFTRAYLRHLHGQNDPLYGRLATIHNLYFFGSWVATMRNALRDGTFGATVEALSTVISRSYPSADAAASP
jgi:queuine tRNA-ribosyltransferase